MELQMTLENSAYKILIEKGSLERLGELANLDRKVFIITDDGVPAEYSKLVANQCSEAFISIVSQGEGSKSLDTYAKLLAEMLDYGFTRGDAVIAVGGGVIGDLAGFVAASYMRGIEFINCPTTTLSQIDSSIGGKVAVNLAGTTGAITKNIVGAFYQPSLVVIDPNTLQTLEPRHFRAGLAEAIKAGLIADETLFAIFENADDIKDIEANLEAILYKSLEVKKSFVEADECEHGVRAALNFGHTIGHAIESYKNLGDLYHGECVALGMIPMINQNLTPRLIAVLEKLNLPTSINYDGDAIYEILKHDKKTAKTNIKIVQVNEIGSYELKTVATESLRAVIGGGINER